MYKNCLLPIIIILVIIALFCIICIPKYYWGGKSMPDYCFVDSFKNWNIKLGHRFKIKKLDVDVCYENLAIFHDIMEDLKIPFWLSEGTALGFFRDKEIIPWDDDVDVGLMDSYKDRFINEAIPMLKKEGFNVAEARVRKKLRFIALNRKNEKIDVDITGKGYHCIAADYGKYKCDQLLPYLKSFKTIKIKGRNYNLPKLGYIKKLYGEKWNTPVRDFKDRKNFK